MSRILFYGALLAKISTGFSSGNCIRKCFGNNKSKTLMAVANGVMNDIGMEMQLKLGSFPHLYS